MRIKIPFCKIWVTDEPSLEDKAKLFGLLPVTLIRVLGSRDGRVILTPEDFQDGSRCHFEAEQQGMNLRLRVWRDDESSIQREESAKDAKEEDKVLPEMPG